MKFSRKIISFIRIVLEALSRIFFRVVRFLFLIRLTLICIVHSVLLLFVTYAWLNLPFDYDAGEEHLTIFSFVKEQFDKEHDSINNRDSILFVNIAYDKTLEPLNDILGLPAGQQLVTDREKLSRFLDVINKENTHRLVFLDIDFDTEYIQDSVLAASMVKTKNLFIPTTTNSLLKETGVGMGAVNGRKTLVSSDFFKYPYIFEKEASIPVKLFELLDNGTFEKQGSTFWRNGKLAFNSIVPNYYFKKFPKYNASLENNYYDLGADILSLDDESVAQKFSGKIILVGDFTEYDQHNTFMGEIPGLLILLNAYFNLKAGNNEVSVWMILFFFLIYLALNLSIIEDKSLLNFTKLKEWFAKYSVLSFLLRLLSFAVIFWGLSILIKMVFNVYLNILLIGIYFAFFSSLVKAIQKRRKA